MFNLDITEGNDEALALEQGYVTINDSKIFLPWYVQTSGLFTVCQSGATMGDEYALSHQGNVVNIASIGGQPVFKRAYIRRLTNGSIF
jgi:hypothetical protein